MSGPVTYVGTFKVKEGKLEEFKKNAARITEFVETNEPRLIAFNFYLDEETGMACVAQVHPDSASMEFHMKVGAEHFATAFEYLDVESEQLFGPASDGLIDSFQQWLTPGVTFTLLRKHEAGFTRTNAR
jgi:quinol monooxygenase YgiN